MSDSTHLSNRGIALCLAVTISFFCSAASEAKEQGFRLIRSYTTEDHGAGSQNWAVTQDPRGVFYIGNLAGVLEFDGESWREIPVTNNSAVFSIATAADGRILVGGIDEFGYLAPDSAGSLAYVSLRPGLPSSVKEFEEVLSIHPTESGAWFITDPYILFWDGSNVSLIGESKSGRGEMASFAVDGQIYLRIDETLKRVNGDRIEAVHTDAWSSTSTVEAMLPAGDGRTLVSVRGEGFFLFDGVTGTPFAPEASEWSRSRLITHGCKLPDGRFVLATRRSGVLILGPDGSIQDVLDTTVGFPDNDVLFAYPAADGSVWFALNSAIARFDASSPLSILDHRTGLIGSPSGLVRHEGALYVGTSDGLFKIGPTQPGSGTITPSQATRIGDKDVFVFDAVSTEGGLLAGGRNGVRVVQGDRVAEVVPGTEDLIVYDLEVSPSRPSRIYLMGREGFAVIDKIDGKWTCHGLVEGVPSFTRTVVEISESKLWVGTVFDGVALVDLQSLTKADVRLLGEGELMAYDVNGQVLFADATRIFRFDEIAGNVVPDTRFEEVFERGVFIITPDERGGIWLNTSPPSVATLAEDGTLSIDDRVLIDLSGRDIQLLVAEEGGTIWIGNEKGLYRFESEQRRSPAVATRPLIRRVSAGRDHLYYAGAAIPGISSSPEIPIRDMGRLRIEFSAVDYVPGVVYQYRLDPIDPEWSEWTPESFADFTSLREGQYTFRVRSRGLSSALSDPAAYSFTVLPPWYRSPAAWFVWILLAGIAVYLIMVFRHRNLAERTRELERVVAEKTRALSRTIEELQQTQGELEDANQRFRSLSLHDALTGIANRRHLEEKLREEWNRARRTNSNLAFILMDLDHFKNLNDTKGHQEGDECLKRVSNVLREKVRRSGELVARYGGEEFAILLPSADDERALGLAREIRCGIEDLAIDNDGSPAGRITASLGVARMGPDKPASIDGLVDAADRALYRAKDLGRNRVFMT